LGGKRVWGVKGEKSEGRWMMDPVWLGGPDAIQKKMLDSVTHEEKKRQQVIKKKGVDSPNGGDGRKPCRNLFHRNPDQSTGEEKRSSPAGGLIMKGDLT